MVLTVIAKGKKVFLQKYSIAAVVILTVGIIGFFNNRESESKNVFELPTDGEFVGRNSKQITTIIEENALFDVRLSVRFREQFNGELSPVLTRSSLSGYIGNFNWTSDHVEIDKLDNGKYSYSVSGVMDWYFLNMKVYSQPKEYIGTLVVQ